MTHAIIVGAGIGGMTAAIIALDQAGCRVTVLENLAAKQRQDVAWGKRTERQRVFVKPQVCEPTTTVRPDSILWRGGLPGAADCSPRARNPDPRLYPATAPQLLHVKLNGCAAKIV